MGVPIDDAPVLPVDSAVSVPVSRSSLASSGVELPVDPAAANTSAIAELSTPLIATIGIDAADDDTLATVTPVVVSTYSSSEPVGLVASSDIAAQ
jgi:hypothetical protein